MADETMRGGDLAVSAWVYYQFRTDVASGHRDRLWRVEWSKPPKIEFRTGSGRWLASQLMSTVPFGPGADSPTVQVQPEIVEDTRPGCTAESAKDTYPQHAHPHLCVLHDGHEEREHRCPCGEDWREK